MQRVLRSIQWNKETKDEDDDTCKTEKAARLQEFFSPSHVPVLFGVALVFQMSDALLENAFPASAAFQEKLSYILTGLGMLAVLLSQFGKMSSKRSTASNDDKTLAGGSKKCAAMQEDAEDTDAPCSNQASLESWNAKILACAQNWDTAGAQLVLKQMCNLGLEPNADSCQYMICACANGDGIKHAEFWLERLAEFGEKPNLEACLAFIQACARRGNAQRAGEFVRQILSAGQEPLPELYMPLLKGFQKEGNVDMLKTWIDEAKIAGVALKSTDVRAMHVRAYNALMRTAVKKRDIALAEKWLNTMRENGFKPDLESFRILIYATEDSTCLERFLGQLADTGLSPELGFFQHAITSAAKQGENDTAARWLAELDGSRFAPNLSTYNQIIQAFGKVGDLDNALETFTLLTKSPHLRPDVFTYASLINAYAKSGDVWGARSVLERMSAEGCRPNMVCYKTVMGACSKANDWMCAEKLMSQMVVDGCDIDGNTYELLITACARSEQPDRARRWLNLQVNSGLCVSARSYAPVIDAYAKHHDIHVAQELFSEWLSSIGPGNEISAYPYYALAKAFKNVGDWERVEAIVQEMEDKGLDKSSSVLATQILAYAKAFPPQPERAIRALTEAVFSSKPIQFDEGLKMALNACLGNREARRLCKGLGV